MIFESAYYKTSLTSLCVYLCTLT